VLRHARSLLHATPPALRSLARASEQGVPLIAALGPVVGRLNGDLLPFLDRRDPEIGLKVYEAIGPFFSTQAAFVAEFDAGGHWGRFVAPPAANSVLLPCDPGMGLEQTKRCTSVNEMLDAILGGHR
jgi:hypothetical protein